MKILQVTGAAVAALCIAGVAFAQPDVSPPTHVDELQALAQTLRARGLEDRRQAIEYARKAGIPIRQELPGGRVLELQRIGTDGRPVFYITYNLDAADTVSTDELWPGGSSGLGLDGSGMTAGIWDGGLVDPGHVDFLDEFGVTRLDQSLNLDPDGLPPPVSGHATHVAGTMIGNGAVYPFAPLTLGMAHAASLDTYYWENDSAAMALAAAGGLGISNHSYGIAAGWVYVAGFDPDYDWWWIGGETNTEDPNFGYYDDWTQTWDQIAFDAPYYLIVKAAGNDRNEFGPAPGETYLVVDEFANPISESTDPRDYDCAPLGFDCLPTQSVAKNILSIGAVDDIYGGYLPFAGPSQVNMTDFSSWGPSDDGRIKPDLVGNGVFLVSAYPTNTYAAASGTSMAAPNVTGSLLLLQQHYQNLNGGSPVLAATLKALAIHTADEAGQADGPDYIHGWGLLNTLKASELLSDAGGGDHHIIEGSLANGATDTIDIEVTVSDARVWATLVWTDPAGTPVTPQVLDDPTPMLVNDLDLRVINGPDTHLPWVLDPSDPTAPATPGDNVLDNVEQVVITGGAPGTYTIQISHKGTLQNAPQAYSLVVSSVSNPPLSSDLLIDEDFTGGLPAGWSTGGTGKQWEIYSPGSGRYANNTGGSGEYAMADIDVANIANAWLALPTLDLSSAESALLRFNSFYIPDESELLRVEYSTDGGSSFSALPFTPVAFFPEFKTIDASVATGSADVVFRFRFNTFGLITGDLWQIDNVQVEAVGGVVPDPEPENPPGPASNPVPANGATGVSVDTEFSWTAGVDATSHDVYFGLTDPLDAGDFQGNQPGTTGFDPGQLAYDTTYYWRVDEVNVQGVTEGPTWSFTTEAEPAPVLPGQATVPSPADGTTGVDIDADLGWTAGADTDTHDVYFGTVPSPGAGEYMGSQPGTTFDPGTLDYATTYYWRVDEVNAEGTTTGPTWSFTTGFEPTPVLPGQATAPSPADGATGVDIDADLGWTAGSDTDSHDVYFGTAPSPGAGEAMGNQPGTAFDPGTLAYDTTYYWRIDEVNTDGTTTGTVWSFTTGSPPPPPPADTPIHLGDLAGTALPGSRGRWTASVDVLVLDDVDQPVQDVTVTGSWSGDANGGGQCLTGADGRCTIDKTNLKNNVVSVSFTVTALDRANHIYDPAANAVDDTVVIGESTDPEPPGGGSGLTATTYKVKGVQHVDLTWSGVGGASVDIRRDGVDLPDSPTANDGAHTDNIGAKGGGSYDYEVCEAGTSNCLFATATF